MRAFPVRLPSGARYWTVLDEDLVVVTHGEEISVTGIARRAGVDRSFLYRHHDLLEQIHAMEAQPPNTPGAGSAVSRASLQADLVNAQQRAARLAARVHQLENRLSEALGEQAWHDSGLGPPDDIDHLKHQIVTLEQHTCRRSRNSLVGGA